ncbi:MAG: EutN/CcmL family microcompartment protein [Deltaproteobacteria bacterium]|nr:EutN/CcmL family microcompartment protein [Deltaproteobacteria bacterium]
MKLAKVVGTVVSTRKDEKLDGLSFFLLQDLGPDMGLKDSIVVAADSVGCGVGEVVLYASGSSARQTNQTNNRPCDATVMAIIDSIDLESGDRLYDKAAE